MHLQLCKIAEKNRTHDLREKEHRDTGTQIYTELNLELLFRLTTTDSLLPIPSHLSLKLQPTSGVQRL